MKLVHTLASVSNASRRRGGTTERVRGANCSVLSAPIRHEACGGA
jgi:hypothetical protein